MAPDGTGQRAVTHGERRYEWPSMADDGTILAPDVTGWLHRLTPAGAALGAPLPTAAAVATEDAPAETPTHVRISPDGSRIAYDEAIDGDVTTLWTGRATFPNQSLGQEGLVAPSWIGNDRLLLSRDVSAPRRGRRSRCTRSVAATTAPRRCSATPGAAWATGLRRRGLALGTPDRGARRRRRRGRRHAAPRRAPAVPGPRVPVRDPARGGRHVQLGQPDVLAGRLPRGLGGERRHPRGDRPLRTTSRS